MSVLQSQVFPNKYLWQDHWIQMPEYKVGDNAPYHTLQLFFNDGHIPIRIRFLTKKDLLDFGEQTGITVNKIIPTILYQSSDKLSKVISQNIYEKTRSMWYPKRYNINYDPTKYYVSSLGKKEPSLRYPIYIVSKGRWENPLTCKALDRMHVPYFIVIEPQEYAKYKSTVDRKKILTLPSKNYGQGTSIPARNWVWDHALKHKAKRHWILDDNILDFRRYHNNQRLEILCSAPFRAVEDFVDRYSNIGITGLQYAMFMPCTFSRNRTEVPPFTLNTRVYSCILVDSDLPFRWRGWRNEDTDLSLQVLKAGLCTVLFNTFLAGKKPTMTTKGGNDYYGDPTSKEGSRRKGTEVLIKEHPDVARMTFKFHRWHHEVNYTRFKRNNRLIFKKECKLLPGHNNYGMTLVHETND
jgi:hypothetical protein